MADNDAAASSASAAEVGTSTQQTDDASSAAAVAFKVRSVCKRPRPYDAAQQWGHWARVCTKMMCSTG